MNRSLDVDIAHRLGEFALDAKFRSSGRLIALFGRSGSGKTSLINVIGGLIRPERGRVVIDGVTLVDTAADVFIPPHKRRIGYVFQEPRLFPHLSVRQNLLFGRWFSGVSGDHGRELDATLAMLGIGHLLHRMPANLSGGEKQRVAIGRALLSRPRLLLMDEPLASLDEERKAEILPHIERLRDDVEIPIVYVSHAASEVARLSTDMVVLEAGRVVGFGSTAEMLSRLDGTTQGAEPSSLLEVQIVSHDEAFALTSVRSAAGILHVPIVDLAPGARARVRIAASDVLVSLQPLSGVSALNDFSGAIIEISERRGSASASVDVRIDCGAVLVARVTAKSAAELGLAPGLSVHALVKSVSIEPLSGAAA